LLERLNEGLHGKLTLICASAGFGKTTLVSTWLARSPRPVAWLSLDNQENHPTRFLIYLIAALQTIATNLGESILDLLQSSQPPPPAAVLAALLNEIAALPDPFVLVLDDYHTIDARAVDKTLAALVEHQPPQMHLVIATREDPHLPLARLRARGQLSELRAADLRFTASEAATFLSQGMGLSLSETDIAALENRTEGWITGLQLAALSMQGQQDLSGFIQAFAGDHRYIVDYLVEEVLERLPAPMRTFLLQTSLLERLSGSLCDAVTGQQGGNARLEALVGGNFFVVPLDTRRQWYRYHHLFAEVLCAHLMAEQADQVATLHRRASEWYEQHGSAPDAIRHALAAGDFGRAADLIEVAVPAMRSSRQDAMLLGWLKAVPDEIVNRRPVLSVGYAYALLSAGELESVEARLLDAERWLATTAEPWPESCDRAQDPLRSGMVVVDEEEFRRLPAAIAIYRAARAQVLGDVAGTIAYARKVPDLVPEGDHLLRGSAAALLGLASWANGDLEAAHQAFAEGMSSVQMAGNISDAISGTIALADIRIAQGRLREAMRTYERSLQPAREQGEFVWQGTADLYVGLSELFREQNDLQTAMEHLVRSKELGEHRGLPQNLHRWHIALARIREARGDLDGALDLLKEAERLYMPDFFPNVRPVAALVARVWIAQGKLGEALGWAREQSLNVADDLGYLREFEHITLARVLLARSKSNRAERSIHEAREFLQRLLQAAEHGKRMGSALEILVLQALAYQIQGNISAALKPLQQALTLAEPEGYVRMFVDEGPCMAVLLEEAARRGIVPHYVRHLLQAPGSASERRPVREDLIEPLSKREHAVLRLLRTDLDGPQIASELQVSLNTVRTHTKNIYSKLGVNNRRAAVRRAEELALF
jgi:LuxR family maltose regulon positive regulatory protein